jgi:hypothetical protein
VRQIFKVQLDHKISTYMSPSRNQCTDREVRIFRDQWQSLFQLLFLAVKVEQWMVDYCSELIGTFGVEVVYFCGEGAGL